MEQVLRQHLDKLYSFIETAVGFIQGYHITHAWKGEAGGQAALSELLRKNELLLQSVNPTQLGAVQEKLNPPESLRKVFENARGGGGGGTSALASAGGGGGGEGGKGAGGSKDMPTVTKDNFPQKSDLTPETMLLWMLQQDNMSETRLRIWDMLCFHGATYVPPNAHQSYTPEASIEVARKWLRLQAFFEMEGADMTPQLSAKDSQWYPVFLEPGIRSALLAARDVVWNVCGHPEVLLRDLMTHERVSTEFAELVAYQIKMRMAQVPTRVGTSQTSRNLTYGYNALINLFRSIRYRTGERSEYGPGGELVFDRTYRPDAVAEHNRRQRMADAADHDDASRALLLASAAYGPVPIGADRERDREGGGGGGTMHNRGGMQDAEWAEQERSLARAKLRPVSALMAARHYMNTGGRARILHADPDSL